MDYLRIGRILEEDFDSMVENAGGSRFSADHSREIQLNADYRLGNAVVELKIVEEEGFEKETRQKKLAALFRKAFPDKPTLILSPDLLEEEEQHRYYRILETPIKTHVKKAAKQLAVSSCDGEIRLLILVNNGYGALTHEEFKFLAVKCASNDTSNIDVLITCGLYFYSDRYDQFIITHFEPFVIKKGSVVHSQGALHDEFNGFVGQFMTQFVRGSDARKRDRLPLLDLEFQMDGYRYVKPAPKMGKPSEFWIHGRPRNNSTGIEHCPPVATVFPNVSRGEWETFVKETSFSFWGNSYPDWLRFRENESLVAGKPLRPFVPFPVTFAGYTEWAEKTGEHSISSLCHYSTELFEEEIQKQFKRAKERTSFNLILPKYVSLFVEEIGQDKANDVTSIYLVEELMGQERITPLVENQPIFFEYALALACAYAIKVDAGIVLHEVDKTFGWE